MHTPKSLATHPKDGIQGSYNTLEIAQWMKNRFTKWMKSYTMVKMLQALACHCDHLFGCIK
jgi:hypothetical protein